MNIFNSLSLPVTQCPMGLNRNGLPIGLQVYQYYLIYFNFTVYENVYNMKIIEKF